MKLRNLMIYIVGVYTLSIIGSLLIKQGSEIGGLVFIISPFIMVVTLRSFLGDGWKTAGLKFNLKGNRKRYIFSIFVFPLIISTVGFLGWISGQINVDNLNINTVKALLTGAIPILLFCLFEELGWRGYLENELTKTKLSDIQRHLLVGIIWGVWHIPYYLVTDLVPVSKTYHIPAMIIFCLVSSIFYGQIRKRTKSVWPAVLTHFFGNVLLYPIINFNVFIAKNSALFDVQAYSISTLLIWVIISIVIIKSIKK